MKSITFFLIYISFLCAAQINASEPSLKLQQLLARHSIPHHRMCVDYNGMVGGVTIDNDIVHASIQGEAWVNNMDYKVEELDSYLAEYSAFFPEFKRVKAVVKEAKSLNLMYDQYGE